MNAADGLDRPIFPYRTKQPILWIIAGPNGSGKSSLYRRTDIAGWNGSVWIINPDLLTSDIVTREGLDLATANLQAVQRIETWLHTSLDVYQTIGVETVLSSDKYRKLVVRARERGFEVRMIYVLLGTVERQIARVRGRVAEGGHDVPEDRIRARRTRSFEQLAWFADHVDRLVIFDNSSSEPMLIASKSRSQQFSWHRRPAVPLRTELAAAGLADLPLQRHSAKKRP